MSPVEHTEILIVQAFSYCTKWRQAVVTAFLLFEALACVLSKIVLPQLLESQAASFSEYIIPLSIAFAGLFGVLMILFLFAELMRRSPNTGADVGTGQGQLLNGDREATLNDALRSIEPAISRYALSEREAQMVVCLMRGYSAERTAQLNGISINTVRTHSKNVYRKLGVHSRQELIDLVESSCSSRAAWR